MHTYELQGYQWDARGWLLRAIPYTDPELLHPEDLILPVGINNFRIQYTAGYTTVPEAVQEAMRPLGGRPLLSLPSATRACKPAAMGGGAVANYTPPQPAGQAAPRRCQPAGALPQVCRRHGEGADHAGSLYGRW